MKHLLLRALCCIGLHWRGNTDMGCLHDITVCSTCKRDVLFIINEEKQS